MWAGSDGDYLAAGTGLDSLYGGPGNDTFQLQFGPTGQQPDVIVGGPGVNSLILKPDAVDAPQLITAVTSTTSTTLDVTDAAALAGAKASNFVIQVDSEQMLVTKISGDTLTVVRGYNGTKSAAHSAGAGVVVETPTLVDAGPSLASAVTTTSASLTINNLAELTTSTSPGFIILVDGEQMLVTAVSGKTLTVQRGYDGTAAAAHAAGTAVSLQAPTTLVVSAPTLATAITSATATMLTVSNAMALAPTGDPNFVIQVNSEKMLVTAIAGNILTVKRGYDGTTATTHASGTSVLSTSPLALGATATTITVANAALLADGSTSSFVIQIDQEQMLVTKVSGNTLTVQRGYDYTTASVHYAGPRQRAADPRRRRDQRDGDDRDRHRRGRLRPANGYDQVIQVDDELMLVTAVSGNTLIVVRGYDSSVPTSHAHRRPGTEGRRPVLDPKTTTVAVANAAALRRPGRPTSLFASIRSRCS